VFNVEIVGKLPVPPLARSFIGSAPTHDIAPTAERQETEKRSVAFINFGGGIPESSNESRRRHAMLHPPLLAI
jgi:hypothetical protein